MFYLHMRATDESKKTFRAPYAELDDAKAQAEHNLKLGVLSPTRIVDDSGATIVDYARPA